MANYCTGKAAGGGISWAFNSAAGASARLFFGQVGLPNAFLPSRDGLCNMHRRLLGVIAIGLRRGADDGIAINHDPAW